MSLTSIPADAVASLAASTSRSLTPLSQCSANGVQPMPTIATRSRIPLLAIVCLLRGPSSHRASRFLAANGAGFPEVIMDAVGGVEAAKRHLDPLPDGDAFRIDVGHLA